MFSFIHSNHSIINELLKKKKKPWQKQKLVECKRMDKVGYAHSNEKRAPGGAILLADETVCRQKLFTRMKSDIL